MGMRRFMLLAAVLLVGIALMVTACSWMKAKPVAEEKPAAPAPSVRIFDIMACNVYVDFDASYSDTPIKKEQHKFLVAFFPTGNIFTPGLIDSITAYGPDGYKVEFAVMQEFNAKNKNGYIYDAKYNDYWYMVNLPTGFMKEGEYTIEVKCKNGEVVKKSRIQNNVPSKALVASYLKNRKKIYNSFAPSTSKKISAKTPLKDIKITWSTLKKLRGVDAYYIFRLSEGKVSREFNTQKLVWWDNVFVQRLRGNKDAGLNRGEVVIDTELKPKTSYVYFVEITDSSIMTATNICIFQPHQLIMTP
jgi:hypothetical protein